MFLLFDRGYGFGGYLRVGNENGAQLLGDFSRPPDLVETLTLRGLVAGRGAPADASEMGYGAGSASTADQMPLGPLTARSRSSSVEKSAQQVILRLDREIVSNNGSRVNL